ncbi:MAG: serine/threonine-protein phosphatase [Deltaproteobacteria bacterium]|nr:serine/threonine-protein phosphatase [Deltaproteobacteria bacterium]
MEQIALVCLSIALASTAVWLLVRRPKGGPRAVETPRLPEGEQEALDRGGAATGQTSLALDIDIDLEEDDPTSPFARILVTAHGSTDVGLRRSHNEDSILVFENELFAIADGMGGYAAGEVASELCTEVMTAAFETRHFGGEVDESLPRRGDELVRAIKSANEAIYDKAQEDQSKAGMGTTVVAARFSPNKKRVYLGHVGDSRCYRLRSGHFEQLTTDHTLGSLGLTGRNAEKLVRALGVQPEVDVDLRVEECEGDDLYVLCSDGLSKMVPDDDTARILSEGAPLDITVKRLIAEANANGGKDNVSVVLVRVQDATQPPATASP